MKLIRRPVYDLNERPFMVIWETTQACDLACRHCRAEAQPERDPLALSTAEARDLLDQVETFGRPRPIFIFTGGDPFKRPDLFELVSYAAEIGIPPAVSPSGTPLLTVDNLRRVKEAGAKAIWFQPGAEDAEAIRWAKANGLDVVEDCILVQHVQSPNGDDKVNG